VDRRRQSNRDVAAFRTVQQAMSVAGLIMLAMALVAAGAIMAPAQAKPPGSNGQIVFARDDPALGDTVVYTANPDGSHMHRLLPGFTAESPHWSPDGSEVAVASGLGATDCCPYSAVIVNPDTGGYRALPMQDPAVFTFCTIWSADGRRLACEGGNDSDPSVNGVYTIRSSDGGGLKRLTNSHGGHDLPIDYSPNGKRLVFARMGPFGCDRHSALYVIRLDGRGLHRITPWGFCDDDGSWSPEGTRIAFEHRGSLFVVHPDGRGLAKIPLVTHGRSFVGDFTWSPNGNKLVFLLITQTAAHSFQEGIATANADGTDIRQITNSPTFDHMTDWGTHPLAH
jgi:Tol biopolymer transport system component